MAEPTFRIQSKDPRVSPPRLELRPGVEVVVGRAEGCDLRVDARRVSGRHLRLVLEDGAVHLEDLGSGDGTFVDGVEVREAELPVGARLRVGGVELELRGPAAAARAPGPERRGTAPLFASLTDLLAGAAPGEERLGSMLDALLSAFGADRAAVLVEGPSEDLVAMVTRVRAGGGVPPETHVSRRLLERVTAEGRALLLSDADTAALREEMVSIPDQLRSLLVAPLALPDSRGALYLDSAAARRRFGPGDAKLLGAFAAAAGVAVQQERARADLERSAANLAALHRLQLEGDPMLGSSAALERVRGEVDTAASSDVAVLLEGESGTGKELAARRLHRASSRRAGPLVAINCAALPPELIESELFGHVEGAFSGAAGTRVGRIELAHGGTLLLDEVGELGLDVQAKLLRVLEERRVTRLGSSEARAVDFRLVAATHRDLEADVAAGRFRRDLFFRLAVYRIHLPPLRERGEDAVEVARQLVPELARRHGRPARTLSEAAARLLERHRWPGNLRELRNLLEQAVVREPGEEVTVRSLRSGLSELPPEGAAAAPQGDPGSMDAYPVSIQEARRAFERSFVEHHLERLGGNMTAVAEEIGIARTNLYAKCRELGIDYEGYRG